MQKGKKRRDWGGIDEQPSLRKSERQEIAQWLGPQCQEFMNLYSRTFVQCPLNSFPTEILNSNERGCSFWLRCLFLSVSYDPGNVVILRRCNHQGLTPVCQGVFPEKWSWCGVAIPVSPLQNQSGVHGGAEWRRGLIDPEPIRGGRELRWSAKFVAELHWYSNLLTVASSLIPWCLSRAWKVLQRRCGWQVRVLTPMQSITAQSAQDAIELKCSSAHVLWGLLFLVFNRKIVMSKYKFVYS